MQGSGRLQMQVLRARVLLAEEWRQFGTRTDPELPTGAVQVRLDGLDGQKQPGGCLFVGEAGRGQRRDLELCGVSSSIGLPGPRARSVSPLARSSLSVRSIQGVQRML